MNLPYNSDVVDITTDGPLSAVRLRNPDHHNSLTVQMVRELRAAISRSSDASVLVLSAAGRHFCAGGDHEELAALTPERFGAYKEDLRLLFAELAAAPLPTVGVVQGAAIGGGVELVLGCDFIVAGPRAFFGLPQTSLGIAIGKPTYDVLLARCGLATTRHMVLLGRRVEAAEALRCGLVDRLEEEDLAAAGVALAQELAGTPRRAMNRARNAIRGAIMASRRDQI